MGGDLSETPGQAPTGCGERQTSVIGTRDVPDACSGPPGRESLGEDLAEATPGGATVKAAAGGEAKASFGCRPVASSGGAGGGDGFDVCSGLGCGGSLLAAGGVSPWGREGCTDAPLGFDLEASKIFPWTQGVGVGSVSSVRALQRHSRR